MLYSKLTSFIIEFEQNHWKPKLRSTRQAADWLYVLATVDVVALRYLDIQRTRSLFDNRNPDSKAQ